MTDAPTSEPVAAAPAAPRRRLLAAAALYFIIVFGAGLLMGPIRVLWLQPVLGPFFSVLCETPFLILAMWIAAGVAPRATRLQGGVGVRLALGLLALVFQLTADVAVGFGLRGLVLQAQLAYFATPAGWLYVISLALFALMPALVSWRRTRA